MRYFFIVNPIAGSGKCEKNFKQIETELRAKNIDFGVSYSQYERHSVLLTKQAYANGERCIVAVGGDGTTKEVGEVLVGKQDAVMGMLPFGTGNDLARATKIPTDPALALEILLKGNVKKMDAGTCNDSVFLNVAGIGFDVQTLENTVKKKRHNNSMFAYMMGVFKTLAQFKPLDLTIIEDGVTTQLEATMLSIGNGTHMGGGMNVTPNANLFDGKFDICLVSKISTLTLLRFLGKFIKGRHLSAPFVKYYNAERIMVYSPSPYIVQMDGELQEKTPADFRILPGSLNMILPED